MNKQSNVYTILYIIVLVVVVGAGLALTSMSLKNRQQANANADKMKQILASALIYPEKGQIIEDFGKYITDQFVVNSQGERIDGENAFDVDVAVQSKISDESKRLLPVYVCTLDNGEIKYILPVYGAGLWGPIWGYLAIDSDGSTVYGAYFAHQGETPGLGAEIEKPAFLNQFDQSNPAGVPDHKVLKLFKDGKFYPIDVVKKGQKPVNDADYVDGVSGGTITSKGVGAMIDNCIAPYEAFLRAMSNKQ